MRPTHLADRLDFCARRFFPQLLHGSGRTRAFLLCLEPGQGLPARADAEEALCYVIEGRGKLTVGKETFAISAGDFAAAGPGEIRAIEAEERLTALWIHLSASGGEDG